MISAQKGSPDRPSDERGKRDHGEGHSESSPSLGNVVAQVRNARWEHALPRWRYNVSNRRRQIGDEKRYSGSSSADLSSQSEENIAHSSSYYRKGHLTPGVYIRFKESRNIDTLSGLKEV
jgi:hypothetical protein